MEREPVAFFARDLEPAMDEARVRLAAFIGADPEDLALVPNATHAINIALRSLDLRPDDEVVALDHAYNAASNALAHAADGADARLVRAHVPFPATTPEVAAEAVLAAVGERTRLVLLDHVTSATALVLPVAEIVAALANRGVETLVDGAHAPGMLPLDIDAIGAAFYAGNGHKWLSAPKGTGFLHVRRDLRDRVRPLAISHGANMHRPGRTRFRLEHDWTGTADPSAHLALPAAIDFGASLLPGGWPELMERNRELALTGRDLLSSALDVGAPAADEMTGSMASVPLPFEDGQPPDDLYDDPVHAALQRHGIQVAIAPWPPMPAGRPWRRLVRISAAPYVSLDDLELLARVLPDAIAAPAGRG